MKITAVVTNVKALVMNAEVVVTKTNRFVMNVEAVVIYKVQIPDLKEKSEKLLGFGTL
ncbi:hypothetical protein [Tolypothrix sp. VBCCA 56010]|uniref:hypothetical protein n=1 Tax=Tolypothrix sp. VBCCA 56010 TaxID=3137731 RepID=UPI003D7E4D82